MTMVGCTYTWRTGVCSTGIWRVICRWRSRCSGPHNVLVESIETGQRIVRPWYPAPRRVG